MKCLTRDAAQTPSSGCTSIPKKRVRSAGRCSALIVAETLMSMRAGSMIPTSWNAPLAGMTFTANKAENLFAEIIGDSPLVGLSPIFV